MKKQKWIIVFFMASFYLAIGQIDDDFSAPSGQIDAAWIGDTENYRINGEGQLQLNDTKSGRASLYQKLEWQADMSWEVFFILDFNPSGSNRLEIFLWSDSTTLAEGSGYLVRIGESGSDDALTLIKQDNGQRTMIATGAVGVAAEGPVIIRMKAEVKEDFLFIEIDDQGGSCFLPDIEIPISIPGEDIDLYFGWESRYTNTRKDKFFFDDIYVGTKRIDVTPPAIDNLLTSQSLVSVSFTEVMNNSAFDIQSVILTPDIRDKEVVLTKERLSISTNSGFDNQTTYTLQLIGLADLSDNTIDTTLEFLVAGDPQSEDLLINEILFNPRPSGSDYIELFNNTDGIISLQNVILTNNGDEVLLSNIEPILPRTYLVLTEDKDNIIANYPNHDAERIFVVDMPRFNNGDGNATLIFDAPNRDTIVIDAFDYDERFHHPLIDDEDGISLERISLEADTNEASNWTSASGSSGYGTPGLVNSSSGKTNVTSSSITVANKIFSPNGDGVNDLVEIVYDLDKSGYVGTFRVYSDAGVFIQTIAHNLILPASGAISWDGQNESGEISPIGMYIIHISLFHLDGETVQKKITVGLGDFLD